MIDESMALEHARLVCELARQGHSAEFIAETLGLPVQVVRDLLARRRP